jgi:hypothetical protein
VLWGEAGVGKSHVLSRLGRWAAGDGYAAFVYLHNLQAAPDRLPRALLRSAVGALTRGRRDRFQETPLYDLVHGALLRAAGPGASFLPWDRARRAYDALVDGFGEGVPGAAAVDRVVFDALYDFFHSAYRAWHGREAGETAARMARWLSGAELEDDQQVKHVLVALTRLAAAAGRPFILAFDQADNLDAEQFAVYARFLQALLDSSPNLLAVTAGVQATLADWRRNHVVTDSAWDRLAQFEVQLQRVTADEALAVVRRRLDAFFNAVAVPEAVQRRREADPLFPLGRPWQARRLAGRIDLRPRDAINWAREGWRREQEALARLGDDAWLTGWDGSTAAGGEVVDPVTVAEERRAVDRAVDEALADHAAAVAAEPHRLPLVADHLAEVVYAALEQCCAAGRYGLVRVERVLPPRKGARPDYTLDLTHRGGDGPGPRTGVLFLIDAPAITAAAVLRRLTDGPPSLRRLFLVTDARFRRGLGEAGTNYLSALRHSAAFRLVERELTLAEYTSLAGLQEAVRLARAGDLEATPRPGRTREATEQEVIDSLHRRGLYGACRLLRELLEETPPPAAARRSRRGGGATVGAEDPPCASPTTAAANG